MAKLLRQYNDVPHRGDHDVGLCYPIRRTGRRASCPCTDLRSISLRLVHGKPVMESRWFSILTFDLYRHDITQF